MSVKLSTACFVNFISVAAIDSRVHTGVSLAWRH